MERLTVAGVVDALFPTLAPLNHLPEARSLRELAAQQRDREDAFIAEHVARRAPDLHRAYASNRAHVALALVAAAEAVAELCGSGREEVVTETLMAGDFAEAGRLLAVRVDALLGKQAKDAAELEAQTRLDAMELSP